MKASYRENYGPPTILQVRDVEKPTIGKNDLLIKIMAATVNRTDCAILRGAPFIFRLFTGFPLPRYVSTGCDFSGEVVKVGSGVKKFNIGDRIMGMNDNGWPTHGEFLCLDEKSAISNIPENFSYEEAAASIEGMHYAINFTNKVQIEPGDNVMINGGTGAIGSAGIQLIKGLGAEVTATSRGEHVEIVRSLGADSVIDYEKEDFTKVNEAYDYVFDMVGKSSFEQCKKILKPAGVYISSELGPGNENVYLPLTTALFGKKKVKFPFPSDIPGSLKHIKELAEAGKFKPLIDRFYALDEIQEAFRYVESGQKVGNVVLKIV